MDGGFLNDEMKRDIEENIFCLIEIMYKQLSQGTGENKEKLESRFKPGISRINHYYNKLLGRSEIIRLP